MSTERQNELAAGGPGSLVLGGTTYLVAQPSDADLAALRQFIRKRLANPLAIVAEQLARLEPEPRNLIQDRAIRVAVELAASGGAPLTEAVWREQLLEPGTVAFLAWLLIRPHHPAVTLEQLQAEVTPANASMVLAELYRESGLEAITQGKATGQAS